MYIKTLFLKDFRNYKEQTVQLKQGLNIFVGDNAQGKTNLLEAIYVLALSKSYRTGRETELIRHGADRSLIQAKVQKMAQLDLQVEVDHNSPKRLLVNGKSTNANSFLGQLNIVLFTPDSLQLIKGTPADRRRFLDIQICQIDSVYRSSLLKYQRVLRQRNRVLKDSKDRPSLLSQIPVWDSQLAALGTGVILKRREFLSALKHHSRSAHEQISSGREHLQVVYEPFMHCGPADSQETILAGFRQQIRIKKQEELRRGHTLVGPQRDDIAFLINDLDLRVYGSQGQQRTAVLAYVLAELELMHEQTGKYPVILLDDVLSELDRSRRSFLLSVLNKKAQTIVTATNLAGFPKEMVEEAAVFPIRGGEIF